MKKITIFSVFILLLSFGLTSCLKDESLTLDTSKSNNVTEFANTGTPANLPSGKAAVRFGIDLGSLKSGDTTSFNINVDYAGHDMAPQDISVIVDIDQSLLSAYNEEHAVDEANYEMPLTGLIQSTFPITLTIPKGQQYAQAKVNVKLPSDYDFNAAYALPLKISSTSVGEISGNFGTAIYSLNVRNIFDGRFTVTGTMVDLTNATFLPSYPKTIDLVTTGAFTNAYWDKDLNGGTYGYAFDAAGSGSYFGNFDPIFKFDADGNVVSIANYYGNASSNSSGRDAGLDPSGVNKLTFDEDGVPKELNVSYFMYQGGSVRLKVTEKFVYQEPRP